MVSFVRQGGFDEERTADESTGLAGDNERSSGAEETRVVSTPWFSATDAADGTDDGAPFDPSNTFDTPYDEAIAFEQFPITGFIATLGADDDGE